MNTKLTLSIEQQVIEVSKIYAKSQGRSLSNIVEEYLKSLVSSQSKDKNKELSTLIKELKGSLKLPKDNKSYKELIEDSLIEKYLK